MTGEPGKDSHSGISTGEDFHEALRTLVIEAASNGVDVRGGWAIRPDDDEDPAWDLEIVDLGPNK
jgi:hypothetical protein